MKRLPWLLSGNNAAIQSGIAHNIDSSMREPEWTYCYGTALCFHCNLFHIAESSTWEASNPDLLQNWQRHYSHIFMRKWGWFLRGQLQVWIEQSLETWRHKFDYHLLTFWGSGIPPRNDNNDARVHNIRNGSHNKLYVALIFLSLGIFIRKEMCESAF